MKSNLDANAQPTNRFFNASRINDRKIDELIGISKGVLADGSLMQSEVEFLHDWMVNNRDIIHQWPANILFTRIEEVLKDGVMDSDEEKLLLETLMDLNGGSSQPDEATQSTTLPLCSPAPTLSFQQKIFCFTGKFAVGSRLQVEGAVEKLGGYTKRSPTRDTDFLVIGSLGSSDWIHAPYGRKIEKAIELHDSGLPIAIVSEEHWIKSISS